MKKLYKRKQTALIVIIMLIISGFLVCSTYKVMANVNNISPKKMSDETQNNINPLNQVDIDVIDERASNNRVAITYKINQSNFLNNKHWQTAYYYEDDSGIHYLNGVENTNYFSDDENSWTLLDSSAKSASNLKQTYYINNVSPNSDFRIQVGFSVATKELKDNYQYIDKADKDYKKYSTVFSKSFSSLEDVSVELKITNPYYNTICKTKLDGLNEEQKRQVLSYVPYCNSEYASYTIDKSSLEDALTNARKFVENKSGESEVTLDLTNATKIDDTSKTTALKCDPFANRNENKYYHTTSTNYPLGSSSDDAVCQTECTELVTVIYGPPQTVNAAMCFNSQVTVKSSVSCKYTVKKAPPAEPDISKMSPPQIHCNSYTQFSDQGGPEENFDECIQECDGGSYTQSCIDQCYNKIYESTEQDKSNSNISKNQNVNDKVALSLINNNNQSLIRMENSTSSCPNIDPTSSKFNVQNYDELATKVLEYYSDHFGGTYEKNASGGIYWKQSDNCYWSKYASYYFSNYSKTQRTVIGDFKARKKLGSIYGKCNGNCWDTRFYAPIDGFKVESDQNGSRKCGDYCYFYGNYTNGTLNPQDLIDKYEKELAEYQEAIANCSKKSTCSSDTATFQISVDTTNNTESTTNPKTGVINACTTNVNSTSEDKLKTSTCFSWYAQHKQDSPNGTGDTLIFKNLDSQCAGTTNAPDDYFATIDFPGTWIKNKGGKVTYKKPTDEVIYKKVENQFCIDRSFGNINADWWTWSEFYNKDQTKTNIVNKDSIFYNILDTIRDFGYFKWNFDVSCFFATKGNPSDCQDGNCPEVSCADPNDPVCNTKNCPNGDCGGVYIDNFNTRSTALNNLFVSTTKKTALNFFAKNEKISLIQTADSEDTNKIRAQRVTGYNWSLKSTDTTINNYPIAPTATISMIQEMGENVYKDNNELDYSVTLTPKQIKDIRTKYKGKSYSDWDGTFQGDQTANTPGDNGIKFYKSNLLRENTTLEKKPSSIGCNNLYKGSCNNSYKNAIYNINAFNIPGLNLKK
ncbi:MAG: hypothetical protein J6B89_00055 [Bacilli bacterium]|nr:hypothetical protein [Bacilli bacterium]